MIILHSKSYINFSVTKIWINLKLFFPNIDDLQYEMLLLIIFNFTKHNVIRKEVIQFMIFPENYQKHKFIYTKDFPLFSFNQLLFTLKVLGISSKLELILLPDTLLGCSILLIQYSVSFSHSILQLTFISSSIWIIYYHLSF